MRLSTRNQIRAKVVRVTLGDVAATVEMDADGQRLVASITAAAARELELAEGREVIALIKASDVMVAVAE